MTFYYKVYHIENPDGAVLLGFKEEQSAMAVRDKACKYGHFQWKFYTELKVREAKGPSLPLEAFTEAEG